MNHTTLLTLQNIQKHHQQNGRTTGIDNINMRINSGDFISVTGRSGTGKSTLLRIIAGLTQPSSGALISASDLSIKMVFQDYALLPWLHVKDNIALAAGRLYHSLNPMQKNRTDELIHLAGLSDAAYAYPAELSGGMAQRTGFARALFAEPDILLLDEAFSSLDTLSSDTLKQDLKRIIKDTSSSIQAVIMVTHNINEALEMGNRLLVLSGSPATITYDEHLDKAVSDNSIHSTMTAYQNYCEDLSIYSLFNQRKL